MQADFAAKVGSEFNKMIESVVDTGTESARRLAQLGGSEPQLRPIPRH